MEDTRHGYELEHLGRPEDQEPEGDRRIEQAAERERQPEHDARQAGGDAEEPRPARERLTFGWEKFSEGVEAALPIIARNHAATGQHVFGDIDLDFRAYLHWERLGLMRVWTARDSAGTLAGYMVWHCYGDPHHRTKTIARCDTMWFEPAWREGLNGYRMVREALDALKGLGVDAIRMTLPVEGPDQRIAGMYRRLGFVPYEMIWEQHNGR